MVGICLKGSVESHIFIKYSREGEKFTSHEGGKERIKFLFYLFSLSRDV